MGETRTKLTYDDYALMPDDGKRHEIIGGEHFVTPAPMLYHQKVSARLTTRLILAIDDADLGEVFAAPVDVQLSPHDIVQPDLVVVLRERKRLLTPTKIKGAPDLAIEILSPSTRRHDRVRKKRLYERVGVREFWLVDPAEHTIEQLVLGATGYEVVGTHADAVTLHVLPQIRIDLARVW